MTTLHWPSRLRATAIHLSGSAIVAALAGALVFLIWYPPPYERLAGGLGLFVLLISVDVVMGPLITLAVFDRTKPRSELQRDLFIVVVMQLVALVYGLHTMASARPVVMALEGNRFRVVSVVDVLESELPQAPPGLQSLSWTGPRLLRTAEVTAANKLEAIQMALNGHDLGTRPSYWRHWDDTARRETRAAAKPMSQLFAQKPAYRQAIEAIIVKTKRPTESLGYLPVISRHAQAVALIDLATGEIAGFAPYDAF
jgi:hypothetical protein